MKTRLLIIIGMSIIVIIGVGIFSLQIMSSGFINYPPCHEEILEFMESQESDGGVTIEHGWFEYPDCDKIIQELSDELDKRP